MPITTIMLLTIKNNKKFPKKEIENAKNDLLFKNTLNKQNY